jgi:hypothetical protein
MSSTFISDERNFGYSAAHEAIPVPLLPSGPGGVRGTSSHRARSSTHRQSFRASKRTRVDCERSLAQRRVTKKRKHSATRVPVVKKLQLLLFPWAKTKADSSLRSEWQAKRLSTKVSKRWVGDLDELVAREQPLAPRRVEIGQRLRSNGFVQRFARGLQFLKMFTRR